MVIFPHDTIVSTAPGFVENQNCRVILRLFDLQQDLDRLAAPYEKRISHVNLNAKTLASPEIAPFLGKYKVRVFVKDEDFPLIHAIVKGVVRHRLVLFVKPNANARRRINLLNENNIPLHVDPASEATDADILKELLEYYLHNPLLNAPIAPFDALMKHEITGKGFTLWDTEYEKVGRNFYIADDGSVSLSKRFHDRGVRFGDVTSGWDDIAASNNLQDLSNYKSNLFKRNSECVYCDSFKLCEGYFKAVDPAAPCDRWKNVMADIKREVRKAGSLIRNHYGKSA